MVGSHPGLAEPFDAQVRAQGATPDSTARIGALVVFVLGDHPQILVMSVPCLVTHWHVMTTQVEVDDTHPLAQNGAVASKTSKSEEIDIPPL